jgi:glutamine synthetase
LCEVYEQDGETPHSSNTRAVLRDVLRSGGSDLNAQIGFEQEYTLFNQDKTQIHEWPERGFPGPQGPYYCGVGPAQIRGRELAEAHLQACMDAGIRIYGMNAEVMMSQWEFQVGPRDVDGEFPNLLGICDQLLLSRWLLFRLGEDFGIEPSLDVKPMKGDWNGAGLHTNFSTDDTRGEGGYEYIQSLIPVLESRHDRHIQKYGNNLHERLTGNHETCSIDEFKSGNSDRGASIRIPNHVAREGSGYFEDRRPGADACPYDVARLLVEACLEHTKG